MNTNRTTTEMKDTKVILSTLWIVVVLNMAYADIFSLFLPGTLEELAVFAGETPISLLMLAAAIVVEISIAMIFLSRVLKYRANRWANIIIGAITIAFVIAGGEPYPHYIFIATIEVVCMSLIIWHAWKWSDPEA